MAVGQQVSYVERMASLLATSDNEEEDPSDTDNDKDDSEYVQHIDDLAFGAEVELIIMEEMDDDEVEVPEELMHLLLEELEYLLPNNWMPCPPITYILCRRNTLDDIWTRQK